MERLFSPCTRSLLESQAGLAPPEWLQEMNLDVSTEAFLSAERAFTFADLYAMIGDGKTIAWLTPHAAVAPIHGRVAHCGLQLQFLKFFCADGKGINAWARYHEHKLEICDVLLRLLAASVVHSVFLNASISALSLAHLMEHCQSLKSLSLHDLALDEHHCRVLGVYSRPGLEIELTGCTITGSGASALAEVLARNQGPTKLECCKLHYSVDYSVLADGLRGNSRLKRLRQDFSDYSSVGNLELIAIAGAVRENQGLVELSLSCRFIVNDETWGAVCDSLKTHPTLESLDLSEMSMDATMTPAALKTRIQALVDMIKVNTSIYKMYVNRCYREHQMCRESVIPYLEMNRLRPRLLAIQKTRPIAYRAKVLGRALLATRTNANMFWMLLSGNAEVTFPSRTTAIAAAANLPTPATATSASNRRMNRRRHESRRIKFL